MRVIKRDKKRERFSSAKLERSIASAAREARMSTQKRKILAREIARDVQHSLRRRQSVSAVELRQRVLSRLERRARSAATAWRRHERRRK